MCQIHRKEELVRQGFIPGVELPMLRDVSAEGRFVCGADDFHLRVFNYNTGERVASFEAHPDYIRCVLEEQPRYLAQCSCSISRQMSRCASYPEFGAHWK